MHLEIINDNIERKYCKTGFFRGLLIFAVFAVRRSSAIIRIPRNPRIEKHKMKIHMIFKY